MAMDCPDITGTGAATRWRTFWIISFGTLLVVLDATIVYVALPSIQTDLRLTETLLSWVVNAYTLPYAGALLLCGRLGDLYGHRRLFLLGLLVFVIASVTCGMAKTATLLIAGRAMQGLAGAMVVAVGLPLILELFPDKIERARALGAYNFVAVGGGSVGLLLGGALTSALSWHWIFFVNPPIGLLAYAWCTTQLPNVRSMSNQAAPDIWGAITATASLMLTVYAIVHANEGGWISPQTVGTLGCAIILFAAFLIVEKYARAPLVPLSVFRNKTLAISTIVRALWTVGVTASFFVALYMQLVLGHSAMEVALALLPSNAALAFFSLGISARIVARFGIIKPLVMGILLSAVGLVLLAQARVDGTALVDVVPGYLLLGVSAGIAGLPLLFASLNDVKAHESGLVSGVISTTGMIASALGLAVLTGIAAGRTNELFTAGATRSEALTGGYQTAFLLGAVCSGVAAVIAIVLLRVAHVSAAEGPDRT